MDEFELEPAKGDRYVEDGVSDEDGVGEEQGEDGLEKGQGNYHVNGKHLYVTWSKSKIESKDEFHEKLLVVLPAGVRLFGGRELHEDGTPHYHVVMSFDHKVHWPDARRKLSLEGDTSVIRIEKPKPCQKVSDFLENTMAYCVYVKFS